MRIADEAEDRYGRKVAWGVEIGAVGDDNMSESCSPTSPYR